MSRQFLDLVCCKCNTTMPNKMQVLSHSITCNGRTSFMRLSNAHPEFHPEEEVLWVITKYIDKQIQEGKNSVNMPIGSKYLLYSTSIKKSLKKRYNNIEFKLLYRTKNCLWIRFQWR
jgi:hypothetical protein